MRRCVFFLSILLGLFLSMQLSAADEYHVVHDTQVLFWCSFRDLKAVNVPLKFGIDYNTGFTSGGGVGFVEVPLNGDLWDEAFYGSIDPIEELTWLGPVSTADVIFGASYSGSYEAAKFFSAYNLYTEAFDLSAGFSYNGYRIGNWDYSVLYEEAQGSFFLPYLKFNYHQSEYASIGALIDFGKEFYRFDEPTYVAFSTAIGDREGPLIVEPYGSKSWDPESIESFTIFQGGIRSRISLTGDSTYADVGSYSVEGPSYLRVDLNYTTEEPVFEEMGELENYYLACDYIDEMVMFSFWYIPPDAFGLGFGFAVEMNDSSLFIMQLRANEYYAAPLDTRWGDFLTLDFQLFFTDI